MVPPRSLLLVKPGSMGDVIHALPVVAAIHKAWPDTRITWVVDPRWASLLEGNPSISELLLFPRERFRGMSGPIQALRWYAGLHSVCPDVCLDLQGLLRSALIARCARSRLIIGMNDAREGSQLLFHRTCAVSRNAHAVDRYLSCLEPLGIPTPTTVEFPLRVPDLASAGWPSGYVVLHPYARGEGKSLKPTQILAFAKAYSSLSPVPLVIAGRGTPATPLPSNVLDLTNRTSLGEMTALLAGARMVVSVDSGPMHLAVALKRPLLGIHLRTDPRKVGPYSTESWIWQGGEIRRQDLSRAPFPDLPFDGESVEKVATFVAGHVTQGATIASTQAIPLAHRSK